ncbi:GldG family protein [Spirochaeta africana]|uniref:ABC-type uncharacterized transport system involved in gliding motility, auxiliary component n=1 Tax=Spirochaeta africana (strain ATCC 700263 / DSM 8902 / Z-7692) TaxID=889378 RepID=H9UIZ8_SPIAZ|nr:GldG family protein [Spirochaeta africana]AFG37491.1 ABC-type uncharacterized transport system involved in gliding motility, auxiliary component [Spirochaeta africana DSM 8902]
MNAKHRELISLTLVLILLVLAAASSQRWYHRFDLTDDRRYTISTPTREAIEGVQDVVTVRYFVSSRLDQLSPIPGQIHDLLREYAAVGGGRIQVERLDPTASETAQRARQLGMLPQQIQVVEESQASVATVFSGIQLIYRDEQEIIPVIFEPEDVEYRVTTAIRRLTGGQQQTVGVLFGTDGLRLDSSHRTMQQVLSEGYRVRPLERGESIPPTVDFLFLVGGADLTDRDVLPLDRFLVEGGSMMAAIDGVEIDLDAQLDPQPLSDDHPVLSWLEHHGARIEPRLVLDSRHHSIPVQDVAGERVFHTSEPYPHWIELHHSTVNPNHPLTARFPGLDLFWASPLTLIPGLDREAIPLIHTSADSWLLSRNFATDPQNAQASRTIADERDGRYLVAGEISGVFRPYYEYPDPTEQPGRLLVIADGDFTSDLMGYTDSYYNADFLLNTADWLANEPELMAVRTRSQRDLRLDPGSDSAAIRMHAAWIQLVNIALLPIAVAAAGLLVHIRRRRRTDWRADS